MWQPQHWPSVFSGMGLDMLDGATDWTLQLNIPNKVAQSGAAVLISAKSDLAGIAIDLPAPLGKTATETRTFQLSTSISKEPLQPLKVHFGGILDLSLLLDASDGDTMALQRGELRLGGEQAILPDGEGLRLHARLDEFDVTPWLDKASSQQEDSKTADEIPFSAVDIAIKQLHKDELTLNDVTVQLAHNDDSWDGRIATSQFDTQVIIPTDLKSNAIRINTDQIKLDFKPNKDEKTEETEQTETETEIPSEQLLDPRDFPAIYLESKHLILNDQDLGEVQLDIQKTDTGLSLEKSQIKSEQLTLDISGSWTKEAHTPKSRLKFDLFSPEIGELLADMNITHNIQGASASINGELSWRGGPHLISMQSITGKVATDIGKGSILEVNPGIGRIFGLLNLTAFQRRLSLDFSDFYEKGFGFDRIQGSFTLRDGDAETENLQIDGPAAKIMVTGRTGLVKQDLNQHIIVAPQITSSVTLATAIANPAAGAALFLAQSFMGEKLDKITSYQYRATGTWDKPIFSEKESVFFSPKSSILPPTNQLYELNDSE